MCVYFLFASEFFFFSSHQLQVNTFSIKVGPVLLFYFSSVFFFDWHRFLDIARLQDFFFPISIGVIEVNRPNQSNRVHLQVASCLVVFVLASLGVRKIQKQKFNPVRGLPLHRVTPPSGLPLHFLLLLFTFRFSLESVGTAV